MPRTKLTPARLETLLLTACDDLRGNSDREQRVIGERMRMAQAAISIEHVKLAKLRSQKLGLMQDLLTGKVTVKVDVAVPEPVLG